MSSSLTARERNRRAAQDAPWQHALERLQQRHDAAATLDGLHILAMTCRQVYSAHLHQCRTSWGRVVTVEKPDSYIIQLRYKQQQLRVVYNPINGVIRTVLPWKQTEEVE